MPAMDRRDDVVVVGAGVIGLATALALLEAGRGVHVIDAGQVGSGSSHGNCGTITPSHAPPLAAPGMVVKALAMMLRPDAPLYIPPRIDPSLWRWLWRFARRCNVADWQASARAKSTLLNDSRARLAQWVAGFGWAARWSPPVSTTASTRRDWRRWSAPRVNTCSTLSARKCTSDGVASDR